MSRKTTPPLTPRSFRGTTPFPAILGDIEMPLGCLKIHIRAKCNTGTAFFISSTDFAKITEYVEYRCLNS